MKDQLWNCPVCGTLNSGDLYCGCKQSFSHCGCIWRWQKIKELPHNEGTIIDPDEWEDDPDYDYALNLIANFIKEAK